MRRAFIAAQDTMPLPSIHQHLPTLRQLREQYKMSYYEVAQAARVRPRVVYWMEHHVAVYPIEAVHILSVFSMRSGGKHAYGFHNVRGLCFKQGFML